MCEVFIEEFLTHFFIGTPFAIFLLLHSCWAFSANGALEAQNFLRKGTGPIPLSEQNLIDCVKGKGRGQLRKVQ